MYFDVSVIVLMVLTTMDSAPAGVVDYDAEWDRLFGHLSRDATMSRGTKPDKFFLGKQQSKPSSRPIIPPAPPAAPFKFDPNSNKNDSSIPSVGANSQGSMEGIAISQNRGIALGIYMVNSTYNNFSTVFNHKLNPNPSKH